MADRTSGFKSNHIAGFAFTGTDSGRCYTDRSDSGALAAFTVTAAFSTAVLIGYAYRDRLRVLGRPPCGLLPEADSGRAAASGFFRLQLAKVGRYPSEKRLSKIREQLHRPV
jgi:hypothetical protein